MEWLTGIRTAIDYMEEHLKDNISARDAADQVTGSSFYVWKPFIYGNDTNRITGVTERHFPS
ncbi:MAG: hypothetical protein E7294_11720 [Lachnospiraceae bacterium]|nr:hypothetical protein [Lachnospiraceae bacterium]